MLCLLLTAAAILSQIDIESEAVGDPESFGFVTECQGRVVLRLEEDDVVAFGDGVDPGSIVKILTRRPSIHPQVGYGYRRDEGGNQTGGRRSSECVDDAAAFARFERAFYDAEFEWRLAACQSLIAGVQEQAAALTGERVLWLRYYEGRLLYDAQRWAEAAAVIQNGCSG